MGKKSAPKPTPPEETAAASNSSNIMNATANAYFKNINQYTPDGSVTYNKTGDQSIYDPFTKQNYDVPILTRQFHYRQNSRQSRNRMIPQA